MDRFARQRMTRIYEKLVPFVAKYDYAHPKVLQTAEFAKEYAVINDLMARQTTGRKLFATYIGDIYNGCSNYIHWIFTMPILPKGDLAQLDNYTISLTKQATAVATDKGVQCQLSEIPLNMVVDKPVDDNDDPKHDETVINSSGDSGLGSFNRNDCSVAPSTPYRPVPVVVPVPSPSGEGFSSSDGEMEALMIQFSLQNSINNSTPRPRNSPLTEFLEASTDEEPPTPPRRHRLVRQNAVDFDDAPAELAMLMPNLQLSPIRSDNDAGDAE